MIENEITDKTMDIVEDNIKKLKEMFPEIVTEDKIDFEKLKKILGEDTETERERYQFTWHGKTKAIQESQKQGTGTLRPCKEESKNWDSTENLYIEGDNLEVLKILQKSYLGKIKMIYIDPPYNTGNDFVYHDDYKDNLSNYLEISGQVDEENNKLSTNTESNGRFHTDWLNMMYPRLRLARNLLSEDGVIFISIGDKEVENLKKVCNEIFGENNYVCQFVWQSKSGGSHDENYVVTETEYILTFAKNKTELNLSKKVIDDDSYKLSDEFVNERGKYKLKKLDYRMTSSHYTESLNYPITMPDESILYPGGGDERSDEGWNWRWSREKVEWGLSNKFIEIKKKNNGKWVVYTKQYERVDNSNNPFIRTNPYRNLILSKDFSTTQATNEINSYFGFKIFEYAKPTKIIEHFFDIVNLKNAYVLDFFSGSSSTAESLIHWNDVNKQNNKFIMVQLPEPTDEKSTAFKAGYSNICEIGKERIRRAGDKIAKESNNNDLDIGFKVFKLDSSNLKPWDPDEADVYSSIIKYAYNVKDDRTNEDLLYEIMLKYGIDLSSKIEEHVTDSNTFYSLGYGSLIVCLDKNISPSIAKSIVEVANPEFCRVVFRDSGFSANNNPDKDKVNMKEYLSNAGVDEFITF